MNKIITTIIAAIMLAFPAMAQTNQAEPDWEDYCGGIETLARGIMTQRQRNVSMNEVMKLAAEFRADAASEKLVRSIIIEAYERPAYSTAEYQQREVSDFANTWATKCWQAQSASQ